MPLVRCASVLLHVLTGLASCFPYISCATLRQSFCLTMIVTSYFQVVAKMRKLKLGRFTITQFASQDVKQMADYNLGIYFIIIDLAKTMCRGSRAKARTMKKFCSCGKHMVTSSFSILQKCALGSECS